MKKLSAEGLSEDRVKDLENEVQRLTDAAVERIEDYLEKKEADIMTI
ncbi:ribosome recycling factor [Crocinitomix catalasitica]|nr:ribosome recycling factor [Crocinitomix catalasitica]